MEFSDLLGPILILLISVCLVATSAAGIQCYNENAEWSKPQQKQTNKNFLIFTLVSGIVGILAAIGLFVMEVRS